MTDKLILKEQWEEHVVTYREAVKAARNFLDELQL